MTDTVTIKIKDLGANKRLDAEYYQERYVKSEDIVKSKRSTKLGKLLQNLTDYHANGSYKVLKNNVELLENKNYAYMVRTVDLENQNFYDDVKYITKGAYDFLYKTKLFGGEIIINKIGSAGAVYRLPHLDIPVSLGMNQFALIIKDKELANYIYTFLLSRHGSNLINRRVNGTVTLTIDKKSVRDVEIALPNRQLIASISSLVKKHEESMLNSINLRREAYAKFNSLLLSDKQESEDYSSVEFSEVLQSKRFDSEYYQPKYKNLAKKIQKIGSKKLGQLVDYRKGIEPGSQAYIDRGIPFIRVSDFSEKGINTSETTKCVDPKFLEKEHDASANKGEILFTKDGTIGMTYVVVEARKLLFAGAFLILSVKEDIPAEYISLVLNSKVGRLQIERMSGGALISHLKPKDAMNIEIPILSNSEMEEFANAIIESKKALKDSGDYLDTAVSAINTYLSESEEAAAELIRKHDNEKSDT